MSFRLHRFLSFVVLVLVSSLVLFSPATAQDFRPSMEVAPVWRPAVQLDSQGDDIRYVGVDINVTGNVSFWAMNIICKVNNKVLSDYFWDEDGTATSDPGDDIPMIRLSDIWGVYEEDFVSVPTYDPARGELSLAVSRLGSAESIGYNGWMNTYLLASLQFKVLEQTRDTNSPLTCSARFVDRDGRDVVRPVRVIRPQNLTVLTGYRLSGNVQLQGQTRHDNITVYCYEPVTEAEYETTTNVRGDFSFTNIRDFGTYQCLYFSNIYNTIPSYWDLEPFLSEYNWIPITTTSYNLLPTTLLAGNLYLTGPDPGEEAIDLDDISEVTTHWKVYSSSPFLNGDASGDRNVNEADLALVGGNFNRSELFGGGHLILSMATDYSWPDGRPVHTYYSAPNTYDVKPLLGDKTKDHWAVMSPDGNKIAFIRFNDKTYRYELMMGEVKGDQVRSPKVITPKDFTMDAFAPEWSPDSTKIAFVGSYYDQWANDMGGTLYIIDATGGSVQPLAYDVKLQRPAWWDNHVVFWAGTDASGCPKSICASHLTGAWRHISELQGSGNKILDMPVIRRNRVYFRYFLDYYRVHAHEFQGEPFDGGFGSIRSMGVSNECMVGGNTFVGPILQFYTVRQGGPAAPDVSDHIIGYTDDGNEFFVAWNYYTGGGECVGAGEMWDGPWVYRFDDQVGNLECTEDPCPFYGNINTVDWIP